jgi:Na+-transporting methylmalonyl-CoA/oxaloacetate decarboxylase gamma subunit
MKKIFSSMMVLFFLLAGVSAVSAKTEKQIRDEQKAKDAKAKSEAKKQAAKDKSAAKKKK